MIDQGWNADVHGFALYHYLPYVIPEYASFSLLIMLFSLLLLLVGISLRRQRGWAWMAAITLQGLSLLAGLIEYYNQRPNYLGMAISVLVVFYLNLSDIQEVFRGAN